MRQRLAAALLALHGACLGAGAQDPAPASPADPNWSAWTSTRRIADLAVAADGVWCATEGGVLRYEPGSRAFRSYTRLDGLAGGSVLSAAAGPAGDLWFGTDGAGLSHLDPVSGRFDPPVEAFAGYRLGALALAGAGGPAGDRVYVATGTGVSALSAATGRVRETYRQFGSFSRDAAVADVAVHAGRLWVATAEGAAWAGLDHANLQDPDAWHAEPALVDARALTIAGGEVYCGAAGGVYRWHRSLERWVYEGLATGVRALGTRGAAAVAADDAGALRSRVAPGRWELLRVSLPGDVLCLTGAGDTLWIGTTAGLAALGAPPPPPVPGPPANRFCDLALGADGALWIASVADDRTGDPHGVYAFDGAAWEVHDRTGGLPSDYAVGVEVDGAGQVWVATWGRGVAVRTAAGAWQVLGRANSVLRGITAPRDPDYVVVPGLARDAAGRLWMTNAQSGLAVMEGYPEGGSRRVGLEALGLPPGTDLGKVAIGDDGLKLVATPARGLVLFDDGGAPLEAAGDRATTLNTAVEPRLSSDNVTAALAAGQVLWVGTDNGLHRVSYRLDPDRGFQALDWRAYRLEHGLPSTHVTALARDDQGRVWVGTRGGLASLRATGAFIHAYTASNSGLIDDRVEGLLYDAASGQLWVGTAAGLARLRLAARSGDGAGGVLVYPNPFRPRTSALTFSGLTLGTEVRIHAADGTLVRILPASAGGEALVWDGTNHAGRPVASGIYLFVADGPGGRVTGRFAVLGDG